MDLDFEKIAALLSVIEKCAGHSGKLGSIANAAMAELLTLNDKIKAEATAKAVVADEPVEESEDAPDEDEPTQPVRRL